MLPSEAPVLRRSRCAGWPRCRSARVIGEDVDDPPNLIEQLRRSSRQLQRNPAHFEGDALVGPGPHLVHAQQSDERDPKSSGDTGKRANRGPFIWEQRAIRLRSIRDSVSMGMPDWLASASNVKP